MVFAILIIITIIILTLVIVIINYFLQQQCWPGWWGFGDGLRCFHHDPLHACSRQGGTEDGRQVVAITNIRLLSLVFCLLVCSCCCYIFVVVCE